MSTNAEHANEWFVVPLQGELDLADARLVRDRLDEQIRAGHRHIVADLGQVTFIDSSALGVLVGRLKILQKMGGNLRIVARSEQVLRVFEITGLDQVFPIFDDAASALA